MTKSYEDRLLEQVDQYRDVENMHDLPAAFHLWSSDYLLPGVKEVFGVGDINSFYVEAFVWAAGHNRGTPTFLSLGCGDGTVEIAIATALLARGLRQFRFVCYDLSDILLSRFASATPSELKDHFELRASDLNEGTFDAKFDAIMANHSLHHMVDLERIFQTAYDNLADHGIFVTSDMIGRNGHMRWPEARMFVDFFWPFLSREQRNNTLLGRLEKVFVDHDCSTEGFEGIRSQDILPLILRQGFHPWKFLGFGGIIDVFVDRCFGPNFDIKSEDDVFLIRRIGFLNEVLLNASLVKPTMMLAYFVKNPTESICYRNRSARAAVRDDMSDPDWLVSALEDFRRCLVTPEFAFKAGPAAPAAAIHPDSGAREAVLRDPQADAAAACGTLAEIVSVLRQLQHEVSAAAATITDQAMRLRAMEESSSWQLTAPLRMVGRLFRR